MEFMNCLATAAETIGQWGFSEGFASIMSEIENPTFVGWLVKGLLDAVGNYGWAVVLFTVILKIITLPLDFWQRFSMKKNAKMMSGKAEALQKARLQYAFGLSAHDCDNDNLFCHVRRSQSVFRLRQPQGLQRA